MNIFRRCRRIDKMVSFKKKWTKTVIALVLGLLLGVIAKLIDGVAVDGSWFNELVHNLELSAMLSRSSIWVFISVIIAINSNSPYKAFLNVLLFLVGMLGGYYAYSYFILDYTIILELEKWIIIALASSILSALVWYAKGEGWLSVGVSALVIGFFFREAFSFGMWYINLSYVPEVIILSLSILILHNNISKTILTVFYSLPVAVLYDLLLPYIGI